MRTKTLLLTAALSAAGVIASMAAGVTSVNVVGYINVSVPQGFSMIANQLVAANDKISALLPTPPKGTVIYSWSNGFAANPWNLFDEVPPNDTWDNPDLALGPGSGALIFAPSAFTITFVGEVKQGSLSTAINPGFQFVSSQVPQEGTVDALGFVPVKGDVIYKWDNGFSAYSFDLFDDGQWDPSAPILKVGESGLLFSKNGNDWNRTFTVP